MQGQTCALIVLRYKKRCLEIKTSVFILFSCILIPTAKNKRVIARVFLRTTERLELGGTSKIILFHSHTMGRIANLFRYFYGHRAAYGWSIIPHHFLNILLFYCSFWFLLCLLAVAYNLHKESLNCGLNPQGNGEERIEPELLLLLCKDSPVCSRSMITQKLVINK